MVVESTDSVRNAGFFDFIFNLTMVRDDQTHKGRSAFATRLMLAAGGSTLGAIGDSLADDAAICLVAATLRLWRMASRSSTWSPKKRTQQQ